MTIHSYVGDEKIVGFLLQLYHTAVQWLMNK